MSLNKAHRDSIRAMPDCAMMCWERGKPSSRAVVLAADCDGFPDQAAEVYRGGRGIRVIVSERWGYVTEPGRGRTPETKALEAPLVAESRGDYHRARRRR